MMLPNSFLSNVPNANETQIHSANIAKQQVQKLKHTLTVNTTKL